MAEADRTLIERGIQRPRVGIEAWNAGLPVRTGGHHVKLKRGLGCVPSNGQWGNHWPSLGTQDCSHNKY